MELDIRLRELHMARDGGSLRAGSAGSGGFLWWAMLDGEESREAG